MPGRAGADGAQAGSMQQAFLPGEGEHAVLPAFTDAPSIELFPVFCPKLRGVDWMKIIKPPRLE